MTVPSSFGRYEVLERVGAGAMGEVYRARDPELRRTVAIKVLSGRMSSLATARERFRREALALARLEHPHVVKLHEFAEEEEGRFYLVLEFVEGTTLDRWLAEERVPWRERVALLEKVCRGVAHAHERGVLHRDLKPGNIFVRPDGRPKVGDFGLARLVEGGDGLTGTGDTLGTPRYMAPEQVPGSRGEIGPWTDVHALGAVLYEALSGRTPYRGRTTAELFGRILRDRPGPLRSIPRDLGAIVAMALAKEPSRRYASAGELAEDLARFLSGARPVATAVRWPAWTARRVGLAAALSSGFVLAAAVALCSWPGEPASSGAPAPAVETSGEEEAAAAARREALSLVEAALPALEAANHALYDPAADFEAARRRLGDRRAGLERAIELAPDSSSAHYTLGWALDFEGRLEEAERELRRAIELEPGFGMAQYRLGRLLFEKAWLVGFVGHRKMSFDRELMKEGLAEAVECYRRAGEAERSLEEGGIHLALCEAFRAYAAQDYEGMARLAAEGARRFQGVEGVEDFHLLLSRATAGPECEAALGRALAARPRHPLALLERACGRGLTGDPAGAIADFDALLVLRPRCAIAWVDSGALLGQMGRLDEALARADRALEIEPENASAHTLRAQVLLGRGDQEAALAELDESIRIEPGVAYLFDLRSTIRYARGDLAGALADAEEGLRLEPASHEALFLRGLVRCRQGDFEAGAADIRAALARAPAAWPRRAQAEEILRRTQR